MRTIIMSVVAAILVVGATLVGANATGGGNECPPIEKVFYTTGGGHDNCEPEPTPTTPEPTEPEPTKPPVDDDDDDDDSDKPKADKPEPKPEPEVETPNGGALANTGA